MLEQVQVKTPGTIQQDLISTKPLVVNISTVGDLISGSSYKVFSEGKEIDEQNLTPGTCSLKIVLNLSSAGNNQLDVGNVIIKKKTKPLYR
ncbi:MAG: hypothetical protein IPJ16_08280 [Bacteroidales bacterium]|nr:hypothetical protein [Bacteroidales bacterium]